MPFHGTEGGLILKLFPSFCLRACEMLIIMGTLFLFHEAAAQYRFVTVISTSLVLGMYVAVRKKHVQAVRMFALAFIIQSNIYTLSMAFYGEAPWINKTYDLLVHFCVYLPPLLLLDLSSALPILCLYLLNVSTSACFLHYVSNHTILLAILRGISVQACVFSAYIGVRRSILRVCADEQRSRVTAKLLESKLSSGTDSSDKAAAEQMTREGKPEQSVLKDAGVQREQQQQQQQKKKDAMLAAVRSRGKAYQSKRQVGSVPMQSSSRRPGNGTHKFVHEAYRVAITIDGPISPQQIPEGAMDELQLKLSRYKRLVPVGSVAVRQGCVILSFNAFSSSELDPETLAQVQQEIAEMTREWAVQEQLLSSDETERVSVQTCTNQMWSSNTHSGSEMAEQNDSHANEEHNIALHAPFSFISPPAPAAAEGVHAELGVSVTAPTHLLHGCELRGWRGHADSPEEMEKGVRERSLCLLACMDGCFLPVHIKHSSVVGRGEIAVQALISLPDSALLTQAAAPKLLSLELWAGGQLVCSTSTLLLPLSCAPVLDELRDYASSQLTGQQQDSLIKGSASDCVPESVVFVRDLLAFMRFQSTSNREGLQSEGNAHQCESCLPDLALMSGVGKDLLCHSLSLGLHALAGLLLKGLAEPPFSLSLEDLCHDSELSFELLQQQQASHSLASASCQMLPGSASDGASCLPARESSQSGLRRGEEASFGAAAVRVCFKGFGGAEQHQEQHDNQPSEAGV